MTKQRTFLIALLMTAAIGSQAHAGMSGTSARVSSRSPIPRPRRGSGSAAAGQAGGSGAAAAPRAGAPGTGGASLGKRQFRRHLVGHELAGLRACSPFGGGGRPRPHLGPRPERQRRSGRQCPHRRPRRRPLGDQHGPHVAHVRIRHLRSLERLHRHLDGAQGLGAGFNRPPSPPAPVTDAGFCRMQDRPGAGAAVRPCLRTADRET